VTVTGYINVDFADVETVMKESGVAIMGMGTASGEDRALKAIENALASPLLNSNDITGAKSILLNISSGYGEHELTMDELGEITDYIYEAASEDALIIRGLSKDENLTENISVTVIATGFESASIFQPYKRKNTSKFELLNTNTVVPKSFTPENRDDGITVHDKGRKSIITSLDDESQGVLDFFLENKPGQDKKNKQSVDDENHENSESTLLKVKHMQKIIKREGLSSKTMNDNIDTFEDVPAYIRRNMAIGAPEKTSESRMSKFTLSSDEDDKPVLREDNAYLNDNVD